MPTDGAWRAAVLALALGATGCAVPGKQAVEAAHQALASREVKSLPELSYPPLPVGTEVPADLDLKADVVAEDGRRSYARGFSLPETPETLSLAVRSMRFGALADPVVVYPEVRLLDERWQVVERVGPERFRYRNTSDGPALTAEVFIEPAQRARYLVVSSRPVSSEDTTVVQSNVTGAIPLVVPIGPWLAMWMIPTGTSHPEARMAPSPTGKVVVGLTAYRPKTLDDPRPAPVRPAN